MLLETDLVPFSLSMPPGERVIVLAPHPDDETFGMGGTLRLLSSMGKKVKVVVLTGGEKADGKTTDSREYSSVRKREALKAFKVLGVKDYEFLGFPDREISSNIKEVMEALNAMISEFDPDVIYSPSIIELNPDHRATAEISMHFARKVEGLRCIFYEITTPMRPNILIDVTRTFKYKKRAMKCYKSQLKLTDYIGLMQAIGVYRTFTLGKGVRFAEAFWEMRDADEQRDLRKWLSYETPFCCK